MKPDRFGAVIFVFLGLAGCKSSLDCAAYETSRFCTTRAHQGAPKQAGSVDDIQFSNVRRATGGPVFSDCILVTLMTPSLIRIIAIDGSDSASSRAYVLVDGKPFSSAAIGDAELVQLIVDARPGHNVVRFEIDGSPMEWNVYVTQSAGSEAETRTVSRNPPEPLPEPPFSPVPEPAPTPEHDQGPQKEPELIPSPQPSPVPKPSRETDRVLEVITIGNGDRILINLNSDPMTILEMTTTADGEREMVPSTR
jgi:hypothetical protein